jgi:hypothetical protein
MGKGIVVIILYKCLSALLRLESKLIVAACWDASVIRGISNFGPFILHLCTYYAYTVARNIKAGANSFLEVSYSINHHFSSANCSGAICFVKQ